MLRDRSILTAIFSLTVVFFALYIAFPSIVSLVSPGTDGDSTEVDTPSGLEFIDGSLTLIRGCADDEILKWDEVADDWNCEADGGGGGVGDLQETYEAEAAPALIVLTDALGGITFEGDVEVTDATLSLRDSTSGKIGLLVDNDDEAADENSPLLRLSNSTVAAGDTQFDLVVTSSDELEVRGDDGVADVTVTATGNVLLAGTLSVTSTIITPAADLILDPGGASRIVLVGELENVEVAGLEIGAHASVHIYIDANNNSDDSFVIHDNSDLD
ncbi:hypothetical protein LCGC14_1775260, partial [marine sediment metagenome]